MGVMNITPNSFSDGGELKTLEDFKERIKSFGPIDALDVGAESTAPMNESIRAEEEWARLVPYLETLSQLKIPLSLDTYHPQTINAVANFWLKEKVSAPLIWNDVSGKFDDSVLGFLARSDNFHYVFCHNLAPIRELSGRHMDYISDFKDEVFLDELASYLRPAIHPRVIFDPTLGFSKTYEQNWLIMEKFSQLQKKTGHSQWLLGFSRKSFLRKKFGIEKMTPETKGELDQIHNKILEEMLPTLQGTVWIRTHRPELIKSP
jgi:dihydropteroate synthase